MSSMTIVEEANRDALTRLAGFYLFLDTRLWMEEGNIHREDGPAIVFPDGALRWFVRGREVTREVNTFFYENKWPIKTGLDSTEKLALFQARFIN
ncbi:aldehyde dehydrogenase [Methylocystis bryophila]|uniref:Aldehyde dehydrogenase n=1 Tax=Methylocystis bryophila TaxID=655015 RepID=A0A1W6MTX9_9HYPH|nr:aldehyde dehydrogenase [Methylocystis bryophila]ARN81022.1 aldehyde dehydrogenase [Methylocystis bryophila]BDV36940.1 hypothetical protein DSM21852_01930 [Methylocystis bryophila]